VGVGLAQKNNNTQNYQQAAKKEALNDLISEIKVNVSSNSVLQSLQNNAEFKQQFESMVKITALNEIENYEVVDSWENAEYFWIYMRLNKSQYAEMRRKRMMNAIALAEDFFARTEELDVKTNFVQVLRLKLKALTTIQDYLNEDLQTEYRGKNVYLVNELISSIQKQLYVVSVKSKVSLLSGKVGKPIQHPFDVDVFFTDTNKGKLMVPYLPMKMMVEQGKMDFGAQTQTDQNGIASFSVARILAKDPIQLLRLTADVQGIIKNDSVNYALSNVLKNIDAPSTTIRVAVVPIKVFIDADEQNLSHKLNAHPLESFIKKNLVIAGCNFVTDKQEADYLLKLTSNTKPLGIIWGNMQTTALTMSISLVDNKNQAEIFRDGLQEIKGFQTTPETAGMDAYKTAEQLIFKNIYPRLLDELMKVEQ
jgi:bacterioferritin (cytochrome b1)